MIITAIYKIQSTIHPERYYIGSAINYNRRYYEHKNRLKHNKHTSIILQNHYNKYGIEDLQFSIILSGCSKEDLIFLEQIFLTPLPYFNICPKAGSILGIKRSEKTKEKQRKSMLGKHASEEAKLNLSNSHLGHYPSQKTRDKMSKAHLNILAPGRGKGKKMSEEFKKMRSDKMIDNKINEGKISSKKGKQYPKKLTIGI